MTRFAGELERTSERTIGVASGEGVTIVRRLTDPIVSNQPELLKRAPPEART